MFHIVLYQPEIPPNTGNIIRLAANAGARLHLIEPLGFSITDKTLQRAGLDYHDMAEVLVHPDWERCAESLAGCRIYAMTTKAGRRYDEVAFGMNDVFLFGPETRGLPEEVLESFSERFKLRIPMRAGCRSMNLSNAVAVTIYEAWRQLGFTES